MTTVHDSFWVIDCGIQVFASRSVELPDGIDVGAMVSGAIGLGVDPFDYFEDLAKRPGIPPLIYTWEISAIHRQGAPWLKGERTTESGEWGMAPGVSVEGEAWTRDPSRREWIEIDRTDAWRDDEGYGEYLLTCRQLDVEPKRTRVTAL